MEYAPFGSSNLPMQQIELANRRTTVTKRWFQASFMRNVPEELMVVMMMMMIMVVVVVMMMKTTTKLFSHAPETVVPVFISTRRLAGDMTASIESWMATRR